jgi:hypothetical protein
MIIPINHRGKKTTKEKCWTFTSNDPQLDIWLPFFRRHGEGSTNKRAFQTLIGMIEIEAVILLKR